VPQTAAAHSHKTKALEIVHPWTPATLNKSVTTTEVFMKIKNRGAAPDRLLGASSTIAAKVELREPESAGAGSASKAVAGVAIGGSKDTELNRNGPRFVLSGLKKALNAYDSFKLTLVFEKAGRVVVDVAIEEADVVEPHKH
jgi:periplasmic copper chaperone A